MATETVKEGVKTVSGKVVDTAAQVREDYHDEWRLL
jgi:hypothetical protein